MTRRTRITLIVLACLLGPSLLGLLITAAVLIPHGDRIARGVALAGVDLSGASRAQAAQAVQKVLDQRLDDQVTLQWRDLRWSYRVRDLGAEFDLNAGLNQAALIGRRGNLVERFIQSVRALLHPVSLQPPLRLGADPGRSVLMRLSATLAAEPQDARLKMEDDRLVLQPSRPGAVLDVEHALRALEAALTRQQRLIDLPVQEVPPKISDQDLAGIDAVLGDFTTKFNLGVVGRSHNIALAASLLDQVVIPPGETFSFNKVVGERTNERGFRIAPIYQNGRVVPGTGGGVCQVSTTLYNAALLAGLEVVERHNHSMPVPYVPISRDATVVYGSADLKLRNPYQHPVYIMSSVVENRLRFVVAGAATDKPEVELTSARTATMSFPTKTVEDPSLPPGKKVVDQKGSSGAKGWAKRTIKRPGQEPVVESLSTDYYMPQPRIIRVGPSGAKPAVPSEPAGPTTAPSPAPPAPENPPAGETPPAPEPSG